MSTVITHAPPADEVPPTRTSGSPTVLGHLRRWSARHSVTAFMVVAFSIAYPVMALPILASHGVIPGGWMPQLPGVDTERIA